MTRVSDTPDAQLWYALNRLETNYWWEVDLNGGLAAHEFHLADGLYRVGENRFCGHDEIRALYGWRARRGPTTARHLINNLQVFATDDCHARLVAVLNVFRCNGRPPIQNARPPSLIADVIGECARVGDGTWRYRSHAVRPVFVGSDIPLSLTVDSQVILAKRGKREIS